VDIDAELCTNTTWLPSGEKSGEKSNPVIGLHGDATHETTLEF
jgi:hypothetical protein